MMVVSIEFTTNFLAHLTLVKVHFFIINEPTFVVVLLTKRRRVKGKESECVSHSVVSCDPMDCNPPGSSVHGILQMRILEWGAIPFSRDWTGVSCNGRQVLYCLDHQGTLKVILHSYFLSCYLMSFWRGIWERMDTCMCMAEPLRCSPETITTLLVGYIPTQNVFGV